MSLGAHARRALVMMAVLASLATGSVVASSAEAGRASGGPGHLSPNGNVTTTTPTFSWRRSGTSDRYEVQVDDSPDFDSLLFSATTVNNKAVATRQLPPGRVYWRVRALKVSGKHTGWSSTSIVVTDGKSPVPQSPIGGEQLAQPTRPALLTWSPVVGATGYDIEVDADGDWIGSTTYSAPGTMFQIPAPQPSQTWHWRVRAQLGYGIVSLWSAEATYEIMPLDDVQIDPTMQTSGTLQDVVLKWLPVPGAAKYELEVGLDRDFTNDIELPKIILSTRYSPTTTYDNDQYFWRVRAIDAAGTKTAWPTTPPFEVQRDWPDQPDLVHPADALSPTVGDAFYYQWTPVRHATRYQLDVGSDPNFSPLTYSTCTTANTTYAAGSGTALGCMPSQGAVTYWRVRALDAPRNVQGIYSTIGKFVYDSGRVQLLAPDDGASVAVPTLRWGYSRDAASYAVVVKNATGATVASTTTYSLSWTPEGTALDETKGPFTWTVQAIDNGGAKSPMYSGRTFSLSGTPTSTGGAPLAPLPVTEDTTTGRFPTLRWEPLAGAKYYKITIGVSGAGFWDPTDTSRINVASYPYPAATDTGTHYLSPGSYDWQVQAFNSANVSLGSGTIGTFTISDLPPVSGQQIALDGRALDAGHTCAKTLPPTEHEIDICVGVPATPVLDWESVPGAAFYMVYVANDRELTNRVFTGSITSNSRWSLTSAMNPESLADNQAGQSYYWYVRACKAPSVCGPDPISTHAAATSAFRKISPVVSLTAPASNPVNDCTLDALGDPVCAEDIALSWEDYFDTNHERWYADGIAPSYQTAMKYRVQVSQSPTFDTLVDTQEVDQTTYTAFDKTWPEGELWWRVQGIDAENNHLAWSNVVKLTKDSGVVTTIAPGSDQTVSGSTSFRWEPKNFAASYRVEVYRNNDATFSPANLVFGIDTKLPSYVWSKYLPASAKAYRWRVRWSDGNGRVGRWSPAARFFVHPSAVSSRGPENGAIVAGNGAYFTWNASASAASYVVEARTAKGHDSVFRVTTPARAYAHTARLVKGSYQWRVGALDPSGGALGESKWLSFKVPR